MLSRVAESLYWMSRYIERAENVARFIYVNIWLSLDLGSEYVEQWKPLISASGDAALFCKHYDEPTKRNVIQFLTFDTRNPNSILSCKAQAHRNNHCDNITRCNVLHKCCLCADAFSICLSK